MLALQKGTSTVTVEQSDKLEVLDHPRGHKYVSIPDRLLRNYCKRLGYKSKKRRQLYKIMKKALHLALERLLEREKYEARS